MISTYTPSRTRFTSTSRLIAGIVAVVGLTTLAISIASLLHQPQVSALTKGSRALIGVHRQNTATFYTQNVNEIGQVWGRTSDIGFTIDSNGDGTSEYAIYRYNTANNTSTYFIKGGAATGTVFGSPGDIPMAADFTGDGKDEMVVWRPSNSTFYVKGVANYTFGRSTDKPLVGDFNGDGKAEVAVYRDGKFYIRGVNEAGIAFGRSTDTPFVGDFNGDGKVELGVRRGNIAYVQGVYEGANGILFGEATDKLLIFTSRTQSSIPDHFSIVRANPQDNTPKLPIGSNEEFVVRTIAHSGSTTFAGGVYPSISGQTRKNIASFGTSTGSIGSLNDNMNGQISSIAVAPDGNLLVGGKFTVYDSVSRIGIVKITPTGSVIGSFTSPITSGNVSHIEVVGNRVFISGSFPGHLIEINPTNGSKLNTINISVAGRVKPEVPGSTSVDRFDINPSATKLVAVGDFTSVNGAVRKNAFMLNIGSTGSSLNAWYSQRFNQFCGATKISAYMRDVDFSPNGAHFAMVATGGENDQSNPANALKLCDTASYWQTNNSSSNANPVWVNYTGSDSLYSVSVSSAAVYVGGHIRYLDSPYGTTAIPNPGCKNGICPVAVSGLGAINPSSGRALSWNPVRDGRGHGVEYLGITASGLWFGGDAVGKGNVGCSTGGVNGSCAGQALENHPGIGFFPL